MNLLLDSTLLYYRIDIFRLTWTLENLYNGNTIACFCEARNLMSRENDSMKNATKKKAPAKKKVAAKKK